MSSPLFSAMTALFNRDLRLGIRNRGELASPLLFLVLIASLFPLSIGRDPALLQQIAPGVIWVSALLASTLSLGQVFSRDYDDGTLEQLLLSPQPLPALVLAKVAAHWVTTGLLITLASPLLALGYQLPADIIPVVMLSLLMGTPVLSFIGAIGVALTVGLGRGGMFLTFMILPLTVPVLIFASSTIATALGGQPIDGHLLLLGAIVVLSLTLAPFVIATALKIGMS